MAGKINIPTLPIFFPTAVDFRKWLAEHGDSARELWVGFYKKGSGQPSITWPEAVDEALCVGWIDGVRKRIDDARYAIRFTPRKPRSIWSTVNVQRVAELTRQGRMQPAGLKAFEARSATRSGVYAFEQQAVALDPAAEQQFRANPVAWTFFQAQPAGYRRAAIWWVISAKKDETRSRRLATLIEDSAQGRTIAPLTRRSQPT